MFTLVTDRSKYFRVKRGQTRKEIQSAFKFPVDETFEGKIIEVVDDMDIYVAAPLENYRIISRKLGVDEEELKKSNNFKPVYPTCKLFVPRKK